MSQTDPSALQCTIPTESAGLRFDQALARMYPQFSRARLQTWIKQGRVRLNGAAPRPRDPVLGGEQVVVHPQQETRAPFEPEAIPLDVLFEDEDLIVIDKPPGLVVHPAAGNWQGTLLNALLHHAPELERLPRAGIIHRLDKDTSGLLVIARSMRAHTGLVEQLQSRRVKREYLALVHGAVLTGGTVAGNIGRHPIHRKRMAVIEGGKPALTHYRIARRFREHTLLRVRLETGRTHQIRVHLAHTHHPVVGDPVYGGRPRVPSRATEALLAALRGFRRQALHAADLALKHPRTGEWMSWTVSLPADMLHLIDALSVDTRFSDE